MPDTDLPTDIVSGKVIGRFIKTVADSADADLLPDEVIITGQIKFTPLVLVYTNPNPNSATIVQAPVLANINEQGYLVSDGTQGVWLPIGQYKVTYLLTNARIRTHRIEVLADHTDATPLNLNGSIPPVGAVLTPGGYAALAARIDALKGITPESLDAKLLAYADKDDLIEETATRLADDVTILEQLGNEIALRTQGDAALEVRLELVEAVGSPDLTGFTTDSELAATLANYVTDDQLASALSVSVTDSDLVAALAGYVTDAQLTSALAGKAATVHTHTSASITDFREAVEQAMAVTLVGSGVTITHEDGSNTITLTGVAGSDAEGVRDAIGAALIGVGPISIVPNDSGDTIVITVSATVNSTDAALRDRATHTGSQAISTITGLQAQLDAKALKTDAPVSHGASHKKDTGSDPLTPADIGAATAAQGAKADTAVQPADLSVYATDAEVAAAIAAIGASAPTKKWRGIWSSVQLIKAYDPIADGLDDGTLTVVNVTPPLTAIATTSVPAAITGTAPLASNVYKIGKWANGGAAPYGAYSVYWDLVAPSGTTQVRFKHSFYAGPAIYGNTQVLVNGVSKRAGSEAHLPWLAFIETIAAGQVLSMRTFTNTNGAGETYIGDLEFWGTNDPYVSGDLVHYNGKFWVCASAGTTSTPGTDGTWTALTIDAATSAQGAKADTAVQPADLSVYATDAELAAAIAGVSGGGTGTQGALVGNALGETSTSATWTPVVANRMYSKKITVPTGGAFISSIAAYVDGSQSPGNVTNVATAIHEHDASGGATDPIGKIIAINAEKSTSFYLARAAEARWINIPIATWLPAGVYWITFQSDTAILRLNVGSATGTDRTIQVSGGQWIADGIKAGIGYPISADSGVSWALKAVVLAGSGAPLATAPSLLIDAGGSVPAGSPVGAIVYEKAPTPVTWDFRLGSLPASWVKQGSPTETFSGSGMAAAIPLGAGYYIPVVPTSSFELELHIAAQTTPGTGMAGPYALDTANSGAGGSWYSGPQGILTLGVNAMAYDGSYSPLVAVPVAPSVLKLKRIGAAFYTSFSTDGGVTWSADTAPAISKTNTIARLGFGALQGGASAMTIQKVVYRPGISGSGRPKGWWDGTSIQALA